PQLDTGNQRASIVRPLLATARAELEAYLTDAEQNWRVDSSNFELHHTRNRIRHEILPRLSGEVNPNLRQTLSEVAEIARAEEEFWQNETHRHLAPIWSVESDRGRLNHSSLQQHPLALQRRLVRAAAESLRLSLEFSHVEQVLSLRKE